MFQERALRPAPAAWVLCRGRCCRWVSPDASSTSISCEAVHGRREMVGGIPLGASLERQVLPGRQHCYIPGLNELQ
jgi:hypothetical protein